MNLPIVQLDVDEFDESTGMFQISLVDRPAMQVTAVKLSEEPQLVTLKATEPDKQYLTSAVIIPNKRIYRRDTNGDEYYIEFTAPAVEKIRNKFFSQTGNLKVSNKNHVETDVVNAQLIESWIITNPAMDKAVALGFEGLPAGTMMATYHIKDSDFWQNEVLTGNVTGFSLEGMFTEKPVQAAEQAPSADNLDSQSEEDDSEWLFNFLMENV